MLRRARPCAPAYIGLTAALCVAIAPAAAAQSTEWPIYGNDPGGQRFSPLDEISRANVGRLKVAWTFRTGEMSEAFQTRAPVAYEATPILVDETLYFQTPIGRVFALDPESGLQKWVFDPRIDRRVGYGDFTSRGVSTWRDTTRAASAGCARRIFSATIDARLFALDARTGMPCADFGNQGRIDLRKGLRIAPDAASEYEVTSPPTVVNSVVVVGSGIADNRRANAASGEVRGFDVRTGALRWAWDPIPQNPNDPAAATWEGGSNRGTGAANAWTVFSSDPARDLVFVPTGNASVDYYGGERKGQNLYANSVVALRASTGKLVWHFQVVHHDLWDYDVAAPPVLLRVQRDGVSRDAVAILTKTGFVYLLDRDTGAPIYPIEERSVPASTVPGERAWPTQPFPTFPKPLVPQTISPDDAGGILWFDRRGCRKKLEALKTGPIFTPPSLEGTAVFPGNIGGAHWGGAAFDAQRSLLVVPTNRLPFAITLIPHAQVDTAALRNWDAEYGPQRGTPYALKREPILSALGFPCTQPPWGALSAVSLATGEIVWEVPLGSTRDLVASKIKIPISWNAGTPNLGGPIVTAGGLVFIGAAMDNYLRAFDVESGRELWKGRLPAGGQATPMTYRVRPSGRQYVVIVAGGHGRMETKRGDAVVAFALEK